MNSRVEEEKKANKTSKLLSSGINILKDLKKPQRPGGETNVAYKNFWNIPSSIDISALDVRFETTDLRVIWSGNVAIC